MQHLLTASLAACAFALTQPAMAEDDGPAVPVHNASYHLPVFGNDHVMVLNVYIPPGRSSNYHTHSLDQISVLVEEADQTGQVMGGPVTGPRRGTRGNVNYAADSQHNVTHRGFNVGSAPFHNIVVALKKAGPEGLTAGTRDVPGYQQVVDNERVRAWRLTLDPGQSVPAITQKSPGMRIVVDGGEIVESAPGARDRAKAVKLGEFFWQDGGDTRAIKNVGLSRVQLVEFELK
jgi:quercetin dioxygenase-like cupin family protein